MNSLKVLYISYNAASDPVAQSQVIPYVEKLAERGIDISLLTYEKKADKRISGFNKALKERLAQSGIIWYRLRYHKRPSLPATIYDIITGVIFTYFLLSRRKYNIIHARQIVPATICMALRKFIRFKWVFDMRGLFAEESVAHNWKEGGLKFILVKLMEKESLLSADFIMVLTRRQKEFMSGLHFLRHKHKALEIIPACVDLEKFCISGENRDIANRLGLEERFVLVYLGSLGTCYLLPEMIDFFLLLRTRIKNAFFLFVTHSDKGLIIRTAEKKGLREDDYKVIASPFDDVPSILSICDTGIYFINPYKKFGSFPIKFGEYLACGLPVVINSGIGDTGDMVREYKIGAVVDGFSIDAYGHALNQLLELLRRKDILKNRCKEVASKRLSLSLGIDRYAEIYSELKDDI
jgi:glycosyltransferase involved in cell wall biosynthesis